MKLPQPEALTIPNSKGQKLVCQFYKNTTKTVLIFCLGMDDLMAVPGIDKVINVYYQTGSSVFVFDFSGYGQSEGKKRLSLQQRVADVGSVITYLSSYYQGIILYGPSAGGAVAAMAAMQYPVVTALITINGFFSLDPRKLYVRALALIALHPSLWSEINYWRDVKPESITVPTLVVYGESDHVVKPQQSLDFYNRLQSPKTFINVPGGDHLLMEEVYEKITAAVPEWIREHVQ